MGADTAIKSKNKQQLPIMDIEELVTSMKSRNICPFYFTRDTVEQADILFVPYNYLVDPTFRSSLGIPLENSILIFDEAHNVVYSQVFQRLISYEMVRKE